MPPHKFHKLRLAVLISGNGTNLQSILDAIADNSLEAEVAVVVSSREGVPGLARARRHAIPTMVIQRADFATKDAFDAALARQIAPYRPDLIVLAGFMCILGAIFIAAFRERIVNIHPSLLPKYRGLDTHRRALAAGDSTHGATVHFVTPTLDDGPIIVQSRVGVLADDTPQTLQQRVLEQEHIVYPMALQWIAQGKIDFHHPQPPVSMASA